MALSPDELQRYARHLTLPHVGAAGQERLRAASVLIVGLGGLGSPVALYLAAAGVGRLGLLDFDTVAVHNLQRQVLHDSAAVGTRKTDSARARVEALNPHVTVDTWAVALTRDNARGIVRDYDIVVDGTDLFSTRYLLNDACVLEGKPLVHASVHRFEGRVSVFATPDGPCYRCLHPEPPPPGSVPSCAEGGVLGVLPGLLGTLQATEVLKLALGIGDPLVGRLLVVDALSMRMQEMTFGRDPECAWCARRTERELLADYRAFCGEAGTAFTTENAEEQRRAAEPVPTSITPSALATRLANGDGVLVLDVREAWEVELAPIPGARHLPMNEVPVQHGTLPRNRDIAVVCHHGQRSGMVADYLRTVGFTRVMNVTGGSDRWSVEVDPSVPRY